MVAGALGLVVGAGAIGWFAGQLIVSPAEAAARAEAPEASLITAAVESRVLSADVIARGAIDYQDPVSLSLSGTIGEEGQAAIVTMVPETGTELPEGAVALEVSGRPVFLLQGDLPVYRDLRPGSSGDDVLQLEQALQRLGFLASADKTWSSETGAAIQPTPRQRLTKRPSMRHAIRCARRSRHFKTQQRPCLRQVVLLDRSFWQPRSPLRMPKTHSPLHRLSGPPPLGRRKVSSPLPNRQSPMPTRQARQQTELRSTRR